MIVRRCPKCKKEEGFTVTCAWLNEHYPDWQKDEAYWD